MKINKAKVISVTSIKGGTGKSSFVINAAGVLSQKGVKTLIIDMDLTFGSIASSLNINFERDLFNISSDMVNGMLDGLDKYVSSYNEYIDVLPSPNDPRLSSKIHYQSIDNIIKNYSYKYDVILIDTSYVMSPINVSVFDQSNIILYVIKNDLMDLRGMSSIVNIYSDMNVNNYKILLNEGFGSNYSEYNVSSILGKDINYRLPKSYMSDEYSKFVREGKILSIERPKTALTLKQIVEDLLK